MLQLDRFILDIKAEGVKVDRTIIFILLLEMFVIASKVFGAAKIFAILKYLEDSQSKT